MLPRMWSRKPDQGQKPEQSRRNTCWENKKIKKIVASPCFLPWCLSAILCTMPCASPFPDSPLNIPLCCSPPDKWLEKLLPAHAKLTHKGRFHLSTLHLPRWPLGSRNQEKKITDKTSIH